MSKSFTPASRFPIKDETSARIERLEDELYMARREIIYLAPDEFHNLLHSYSSCETRAETYRWTDGVAEQIIERAVPLDGYQTDIFGERAFCPLCRGGTQSRYEKGFSLPVGLHRHLVGYGQSVMCSVMGAARKLAVDAWTSKFTETEAVEKARALKNIKARMEAETLFVFGPEAEPVLFDDSYGYGKKPRHQDETQFSLHWAERRLTELGFELAIDGRKRSYTKSVTHSMGQFIVFADPRSLGEIEFRVFEVDVSPRKRKKTLNLSNFFNIRDSFKNQLREKVAAGVDAAIAKFKR